MVGFPPKSSHFNRGFHYFHHPFWGTPIFGTPILFTTKEWPLTAATFHPQITKKLSKKPTKKPSTPGLYAPKKFQSRCPPRFKNSQTNPDLLSRCLMFFCSTTKWHTKVPSPRKSRHPGQNLRLRRNPALHNLRSAPNLRRNVVVGTRGRWLVFVSRKFPCQRTGGQKWSLTRKVGKEATKYIPWIHGKWYIYTYIYHRGKYTIHGSYGYVTLSNHLAVIGSRTSIPCHDIPTSGVISES